jgi:FkbH-like protein
MFFNVYKVVSRDSVLEDVKELVSAPKIRGIMDYMRLAGKIDDKLDFENSPEKSRIKIAILSSFNVSGMREALMVKCLQSGFYPAIYVGGYNQYNQEILDPTSSLYEFKPDLLILLIDTMTIAGETYLQPYSITDEERKQWVQSTADSTLSLIGIVKKNSKAKILVHNFEVPTHTPIGIIEDRQPYGFRESVENLNSRLAEALRADDRAFVFDYESFVSKVGKNHAFDPKMYYLGDMRINPQVVPQLCDEYLPYVRAMLSKNKKCLVLDLDNVLWGGIIGEDGIGGIRLGPTPEGRPFIELQKYILSLYNRGVILAINSANNMEDAVEVFRNHPYMVLKEDHFAAMKINWDDKVSNMKSIADDIEIGVDSLVFVDDSKVNRDVMKQALPDVLTVDLPDDPALYLEAIENLRVFDALQFTAEDRRRGKMYAEQRKRQEYRKVAGDISEYLKSLNTVVTIERANKLNTPRISQLTQKTNQFNTTTRRYPEDDIVRLAHSDKHLVLALRVEDKFGDSGLTGVAIVEKGYERWRVDSFLLSCRVLGRKVEDTLLAYIIDQARREGAKSLIGEFIPTKKNAPARDFYRDHGFTQLSKADGVEVWEKQLQDVYPFPQFIQVITR